MLEIKLRYAREGKAVAALANTDLRILEGWEFVNLYATQQEVRVAYLEAISAMPKSLVQKLLTGKPTEQAQLLKRWDALDSDSRKIVALRNNVTMNRIAAKAPWISNYGNERVFQIANATDYTTRLLLAANESVSRDMRIHALIGRIDGCGVRGTTKTGSSGTQYPDLVKIMERFNPTQDELSQLVQTASVQLMSLLLQKYVLTTKDLTTIGNSYIDVKEAVFLAWKGGDVAKNPRVEKLRSYLEVGSLYSVSHALSNHAALSHLKDTEGKVDTWQIKQYVQNPGFIAKYVDSALKTLQIMRKENEKVALKVASSEETASADAREEDFTNMLVNSNSDKLIAFVTKWGSLTVDEARTVASVVMRKDLRIVGKDIASFAEYLDRDAYMAFAKIVYPARNHSVSPNEIINRNLSATDLGTITRASSFIRWGDEQVLREWFDIVGTDVNMMDLLLVAGSFKGSASEAADLCRN